MSRQVLFNSWTIYRGARLLFSETNDLLAKVPPHILKESSHIPLKAQLYGYKVYQSVHTGYKIFLLLVAIWRTGLCLNMMNPKHMFFRTVIGWRPALSNGPVRLAFKAVTCLWCDFEDHHTLIKRVFEQDSGYQRFLSPSFSAIYQNANLQPHCSALLSSDKPYSPSYRSYPTF